MTDSDSPAINSDSATVRAALAGLIAAIQHAKTIDALMYGGQCARHLESAVRAIDATDHWVRTASDYLAHEAAS